MLFITITTIIYKWCESIRCLGQETGQYGVCFSEFNLK